MVKYILAAELVRGKALGAAVRPTGAAGAPEPRPLLTRGRHPKLGCHPGRARSARAGIHIPMPRFFVRCRNTCIPRLAGEPAPDLIRGGAVTRDAKAGEGHAVAVRLRVTETDPHPTAFASLGGRPPLFKGRYGASRVLGAQLTTPPSPPR